MPIDPRAVGALQISQDDSLAIFLHLGMKAADALVIELDGVLVLPPNGDWRFHVAINATSLKTFEDLHGNERHRYLLKFPVGRKPAGEPRLAAQHRWEK